MKASQQLAGGRNRLCEWAWYAIALVLVLAFGALNLQLPFVSDQIATMMGAKTLAQGGTLYVDFWDNKMPGLYWFYLLAGESFGYTEFGIHLLDMIWMTVFSVILALSLRTYFTYPWLSALPPLTVVGLYYVSVETQQLTQLEILVALPMFLSAWFATRFPKSAGRFILAFTASGLCAGIAVVFKLVFALLFVAFWLVVTVHLRASKRLEWFSIAARVWLPVSVGVGAVLGAVVLKFWLDGALFELYWTAFVYPPQALAMSTPAPYYRLGESLIFIGTYFAPWALFIAFAVAHWWRHERDPLTSVLVAWFLVGIVIIYIQRFSWWPYHFLILFTPAGILGIRGADVACDFIMNVKRERAWSAYLVSAMIVFPGIAALAVPAGQKANAYIEVFVKKPGTVQDFHQGISTFYRRIFRSTRFLVDEGARPGKIYVFGDPLYYYLSGRESALSIIGWPWGYFLQSQWFKLPEQLEAARAPYIYVDKRNLDMMKLRGGGVLEFIETHYTGLFNDHQGTWWGAKPKSWSD